jgi:hypothetical protein
MNEYRCTRQRFGKPADCDGHYVEGKDEHEALALMAKKYPQDIEEGYWFDWELWKEDVNRHDSQVHDKPSDCR